MNEDLYKFEKSVNELYRIMIQPIHEYYKAAAVQNCRLELGIIPGSSFSEKYAAVMKDCRETGSVYTPEEIAEYIVKNTVSREEIAANPYIRIADPACGTGNMILPCFRHLKNLYTGLLEEINVRHGLSLSEEGISKHILDFNLFGFDLDRLANRVLLADLFAEAGITVTPANRQQLDRTVHEIVEVEYKNCPETWKAIKENTAGPHNRQAGILPRRSTIPTHPGE